MISVMIKYIYEIQLFKELYLKSLLFKKKMMSNLKNYVIRNFDKYFENEVFLLKMDCYKTFKINN